MLLANMDVRRAFPILAALLVCASGSRVELVNNGYSGLVIGIDDKVDVLQCHDLLGNLQTLINNASSYLYTATNQRAFFSDVTVVVPSSWPRSCTGADPPGQATTESYLTSDLRVSTAHPVYGSAPWTHQSGLCGQPGAFVQFAAGYVASGDNRTFGDQGKRFHCMLRPEDIQPHSVVVSWQADPEAGILGFRAAAGHLTMTGVGRRLDIRPLPVPGGQPDTSP
ncbi:calcium-activated chloride channel regulator family member 3-like [Pollicipes pollicipes]|uniref:calcium-activated chloride channel regulator family member 3-like n=1 Tax=Pollicipes pollicipes TaxID=41117 RepID=UPI001884AD16|nr:calcium-activated chloride channel regulator family member 3-like [Pollicipes pollicipes]